jgi:hypothetical protein
MRYRSWPLVLIMLFGAGTTSHANDAPLLSPTRPVAVVYRLAGASEQQGARKLMVTYGTQNRVRMDFFRFPEATEPFASLIYDPTINRITTVLPERQGYVQRDVGNLPSPGAFLNAGMTFARLGTVKIAGLECRDWRVLNGNAGEGSACVTDDGVVLRAIRKQPAEGLIEASSVHYETAPASLFAPPSAFSFIPSPDFPQIGPPTAPR